MRSTVVDALNAKLALQLPSGSQVNLCRCAHIEASQRIEEWLHIVTRAGIDIKQLGERWACNSGWYIWRFAWKIVPNQESSI